MYFTQGTAVGIDATIKMEGPTQYTLLENSTIRIPTGSQNPFLKILFEQIKKKELKNNSLVVVQQNVHFDSLSQAATFIFGHSPTGHGYQPWNLKKEYIKTSDAIQILQNHISFTSLPLLLEYYTKLLCTTCFISFIKEIPDYCNSESEIVHELLKFMKLYDEFFEFYPKMKMYLVLKHQTIEYSELINAIKEGYLSEDMYTAFIRLKNQHLRQTIFKNLYKMQGNASVYEVMKYIYVEYPKVKKIVSEETSYVKGLIVAISALAASTIHACLTRHTDSKRRVIKHDDYDSLENKDKEA